MALSTASELKLAVQDWLDRADYGAVADDMIALAEGHFNLELRCRNMETVVELSPDNGTYTLPDDFLGAIRVAAMTSPRRLLAYVGPGIVHKLHDVSVGGVPCDYTIIGNALYAYPVQEINVELIYWQAVPSLLANDTNWLLARYPNLYLEACMLEAHRYFRNDAQLGISASRVSNMIDRLNESGMVEKLADASYTPWSAAL